MIMTKTYADMLAAARAVVKTISIEDAKKLLGDPNVVFLDVRDGTEVALGKVKGALHVQRGLLESKVDPASPGYVAAITPEKTLITYCASGGRAFLAGQTLQEMGYARVMNMGKFQDWKDAGGATE
jgi:rhodanese-related sulfurtransferase